MNLVPHKKAGVLHIPSLFDFDQKHAMLTEFHVLEKFGFFDSSEPKYLPSSLAAGVLDRIYSIEGRKFSPLLLNNIKFFVPEIRKAFSDLNPAFRNFLKVNTYTTILARMNGLQHLLSTQGKGQFTIITFLDGAEPKFSIEGELYPALYSSSYIFPSAYFFELMNCHNTPVNLMLQFVDLQEN